MNEATEAENRAGNAGRRQTAARDIFDLYFRDDVPDLFADPNIRARVAETIARAAMKGNTGRY
jgi:hypothetical protein